MRLGIEKLVTIAAASLAMFAPASLQAMIVEDPVVPADASRDIVVIAEPSDPASLGRFVTEIASETEDRQLARWHSEICPTVIGLRDDINDYVAETVRSVAAMTGAPVADEGCLTNMLIVMSEQPDRFVETLAEQRPNLFANVSQPDIRRMIEGVDTIRVWSRLEVRGPDGEQLDNDTLTGVLGGRIQRATRMEFYFRSIVVDLEQVDNVSMQQLSGLIAMLALAQVNYDRPIESDRTILNLFSDNEAAPADLTNWDIAYLRALYSTESAFDALAQRSAMIRHAREGLARSND